ncbi:sugar ABC transporter substrate-binding protein [Cephaloticoccus primus]|uniref:Sugar ABC transporter substrate-binding protein n=1 Tax=Cephaloticoccus primus TaxID=1548207 RepID=A0A139SLV4_9BACT|nr:substrate-binding domain-containing protein [Cephaloticoccus primus]KXU35527.1 sugar ABC transporter substrate-binding protein [Cephaloticoccus primus]
MKLRRPALLLLGLFALCASVFAAPTKDRYRIAVVPKGTSHEFWKSVQAGLVKAQREFAEQGTRIDIMWKGPLREDDREQQIQVVENFVARRVDALVLAPLDGRALVPPVELAARAKIPVVLVDSGLESDIPVSSASTDNYNGGVIAARRLAELLGGRGKVILLRVVAGSMGTGLREQGFLDTIAKEFPEMRVLSSDQYGGPTRDTAYRSAQNLVNRYGREVDGVFAANESSCVGMLLALRDAGLAGGRVKLVGFDAATQLVDALRAGDIQGLVVQDPLNMGYLGVKSAVAALRGEPLPKVIDTGSTMVTAENMDAPEVDALLHPPLSEYL